MVLIVRLRLGLDVQNLQNPTVIADRERQAAHEIGERDERHLQVGGQRSVGRRSSITETDPAESQGDRAPCADREQHAALEGEDRDPIGQRAAEFPGVPSGVPEGEVVLGRGRARRGRGMTLDRILDVGVIQRGHAFGGVTDVVKVDATVVVHADAGRGVGGGEELLSATGHGSFGVSATGHGSFGVLKIRTIRRALRGLSTSEGLPTKKGQPCREFLSDLSPPEWKTTNNVNPLQSRKTGRANSGILLNNSS